MQDKDSILDEIFSNDPLGLLSVKAKKSNVKTADERLLASFNEINDFFEKNKRAPEANPSNISEYQLYTRLKHLKEDEEKYLALEEADKHNLLPKQAKEINTIDDIFEDDILGIFSSDDGDLFNFKHTPKEIDRAQADFVARRKKCKNFEDYEASFAIVQKELASGERELIDFKETLLKPGNYYVNNGVLLFLESVNEETREWHREGEGNRIREFKDGRTRTIFENGTESMLYFRSLAKALISNGKAVTRSKAETLSSVEKGLQGITEEDTSTGYIYILKSKSTDPTIKSFMHLYKIGFSTTSVEERIKNAEKEPTYLMAPVKVMGVFQSFNMNTHKFEQLIHNVLGNSCLELEVKDQYGRKHHPKEWFLVPLAVIEEIIALIVSGQIMEYKYDPISQVLYKR